MRVLWIAIVLALFKCNCGQDETATVNDDLINSLFNTNEDMTPENKMNAPESETEPGMAQDPNLSPKVANVSRSS